MRLNNSRTHLVNSAKLKVDVEVLLIKRLKERVQEAT